MKLNYLTKEEAKLGKKWWMLQLVLGLQTCKTKADALELLEDAYTQGFKAGKRTIKR